MLTEDNVAQLLFIPVFHAILPLFFLFGLFVPAIRVKRFLLSFSLDGQVMRKLAFLALVAVPLLEELTHDCLRIDTKRDFLYLYRLEEFSSLSFCFFGGLLFFFSCCFLRILTLLIRRLCRSLGLLNLLNLFLSRSSLFLLCNVELVVAYADVGEGGKRDGRRNKRHRSDSRGMEDEHTFFMPKVWVALA